MQQKHLPQHWNAKRLVIEGPAGSGKTQTLLRVGLEHLAQGRRVLFCCYNKTLAAEVRRELAGKTIATADSEFLAFDYYELAKFLQPNLRVTTVASGGARYGEYLQGVAQATRVDRVEEFDVVLVDESQDISDEQWKLIQSVCGKETYLAIAMGRRQELYRSDQCEAVVRWAEKAERSKLQRRFRDAAQGYFVGQAFSHMNFLSGGFDSTESIRWMQQQKTKNLSQDSKANQLDFGGAENTGSVIRVTSAETVQEDVKELVGKMAKHKEPVNALIILSSKKSRGYRLALEQLESLNLKYFDLVRPENRRISPPRSAIRITTAHSARGLEADYVLVLDFERICEWLNIGHRLSYVALSRSRIETTVSRASGVGPSLTALTEIISAYDRTA
jgi:superfamily I DNA and RNA helicase